VATSTTLRPPAATGAARAFSAAAARSLALRAPVLPPVASAGIAPRGLEGARETEAVTCAVKSTPAASRCGQLARIEVAGLHAVGDGMTVDF
jgi:hypothetical protein